MLNPFVHINIDIVSPQAFPVSLVAIDELIELGRKEMLDAKGVS
jgi:hypothetical protein